MVVITVFLREGLYQFCYEQARKEDMTVSEYIKKLVITELKAVNHKTGQCE